MRGSVTIFEEATMALQYASCTSAKLVRAPQMSSYEETFKWLLSAYMKASKGANVVFLSDNAELSPPYQHMADRLFYAHSGILVQQPEHDVVPESERITEQRIVHLPLKHSAKEMIQVINSARNGLNVNSGPGIGNFKKGCVLIVGDKQSPLIGTVSVYRPNWPFISSNPNGCSVWLASRLSEAGISAQDLYWVNAYSPRGTPLDCGRWVSELKPCGVVALGKGADKWCQDNLMDHSVVHHPNFWKRMYPGKSYQLTKFVHNYLSKATL